jgi:hypothetical protein
VGGSSGPVHPTAPQPSHPPTAQPSMAQGRPTLFTTNRFRQGHSGGQQRSPTLLNTPSPATNPSHLPSPTAPTTAPTAHHVGQASTRSPQHRNSDPKQRVGATHNVLNNASRHQRQYSRHDTLDWRNSPRERYDDTKSDRRSSYDVLESEDIPRVPRRQSAEMSDVRDTARPKTPTQVTQ